MPVADFVSESDVRQAIRDGRKIYICAKSIVTPSARDMANGQPEEVLVMTRSEKAAGSAPTDY